MRVAACTSSVGSSRARSQACRDQRHQIRAVVGVLDAPAAVVQADHGDVEPAPGRAPPRRRSGRGSRSAPRTATRSAIGECCGDGLGDDVHGVRVVEDPRVRGRPRSMSAMHALAARAIARSAMKKPPGPCVSWPITPCCSGIRSSCTRAAKPPGPEARQHGVAVRRAPARRSVVARDRDVEPARLRHLLGERRGPARGVGVEVDQHDLGAVEVVALVR